MIGRRELKEAAKQVFHAGQLVSLTCVSLSLRKADKMKYSYSGVQVMVRFDKHLQVAPADEESSRSLCGFPELKLADLARTIPETLFCRCSSLHLASAPCAPFLHFHVTSLFSAIT